MSHHIDPNERPHTLEIVFGFRLLRPVIFVGLVAIGVAMAKILEPLGTYVLLQLLRFGAMLCRG